MQSSKNALDTVKHVLQGRGLASHPLHVAINHVPLGMWEGGIVFDVMSRQRRWRKLSEAGYYLNLFGIFAAVPTAMTGLAEWWDIPSDHPAWKVATAHAALNDIALGLALYNWWTRRDRRNFAVDDGNLWADGALAAILTLSGFLGGVVAHEYGYGTHRQGSAVEKEQESLVGSLAQIDEPTTIRAAEGLPATSVDSWAGTAADELADRDGAVEGEIATPRQSREIGGAGI